MKSTWYLVVLLLLPAASADHATDHAYEQVTATLDETYEAVSGKMDEAEADAQDRVGGAEDYTDYRFQRLSQHADCLAMPYKPLDGAPAALVGAGHSGVKELFHSDPSHASPEPQLPTPGDAPPVVDFVEETLAYWWADPTEQPGDLLGKLALVLFDDHVGKARSTAEAEQNNTRLTINPGAASCIAGGNPFIRGTWEEMAAQEIEHIRPLAATPEGSP